LVDTIYSQLSAGAVGLGRIKLGIEAILKDISIISHAVSSRQVSPKMISSRRGSVLDATSFVLLDNASSMSIEVRIKFRYGNGAAAVAGAIGRKELHETVP
jgi:hypothetical protein